MSISYDVNLLWYKDKSNIYLKLFDLKNSLQVYVEANHVDDAANAKPSNVAQDEVGDVVVILFLQFYNMSICLDIKDFDVYDLNPYDDHFFPILLFAISFLMIPRMMFLHMSVVLSLVLIFNFPIIMLLLKYVKDLAF
jgi:hypothetical protein